ncbi:MAG: hypothetical protein KF774_19615 [Planctomyces sp.]|nr:hypothetical protein [Planctomyces sp.]
MNCIQWRERLAERIEQRLPGPPGFAEHAATCGDDHCRQALADAALLEALLPDWRNAVPTVDLTERVLADLAATPPRPKAIVARGVAGAGQKLWLTAAAGVIIAAGVGLLSPERPGTQPTTAAVPSPGDAAGSAVTDRSGLAAAPSPHEIGRRYLAWVEGPGTLVADAVGVVLPTGASRAASESRSAWSSDLMQRLEPAQRGISEALLLLEEQLPAAMHPAT